MHLLFIPLISKVAFFVRFQPLPVWSIFYGIAECVTDRWLLPVNLQPCIRSSSEFWPSLCQHNLHIISIRWHSVQVTISPNSFNFAPLGNRWDLTMCAFFAVDMPAVIIGGIMDLRSRSVTTWPVVTLTQLMRATLATQSRPWLSTWQQIREKYYQVCAE